jgi:ABC exporter DevB family membrane fusion protein
MPEPHHSRASTGALPRHRFLGLTALLLGLATAAPSLAIADVVALGHIVPGEKVRIIAAPPGSIVAELNVERGQRVEAGQRLAVLRHADRERAQLQRAEQELRMAQIDLQRLREGERAELIAAQIAEIAALQAESEIQQQRVAQFTALVAQGLLAQDSFDDIVIRNAALSARIEAETSRLLSMRSGRVEDIERAEAALLAAEATVALALANYQQQNVIAPISGEVLSIAVFAGEGVGPAGEVLRMGDTANMMVRAEVDEADVHRLRLGAAVTITSMAFSGSVDGELIEIEPLFDSNFVQPITPAAYVDRRVVPVRIRIVDSAPLQSLSHAHVTVRIHGL